MKRGKTSNEEDNTAFKLKWKTTRVYPNEDFTNATESSQSMRDKLDSLDEYIDAEIRMQSRIFKHMGCSEKESTAAIWALRKAYETSPANK